MIERSLRCWQRGWWALLPGLGVFFAFGALRAFIAAFRQAREQWNPAQPQLYAGAVLALFSLLLHALALSTAVWLLLRAT